jgi:hypothetical protein
MQDAMRFGTNISFIMGGGGDMAVAHFKVLTEGIKENHDNLQTEQVV